MQVSQIVNVHHFKPTDITMIIQSCTAVTIFADFTIILLSNDIYPKCHKSNDKSPVPWIRKTSHVVGEEKRDNNYKNNRN